MRYGETAVQKGLHGVCVVRKMILLAWAPALNRGCRLKHDSRHASGRIGIRAVDVTGNRAGCGWFLYRLLLREACRRESQKQEREQGARSHDGSQAAPQSAAGSVVDDTSGLSGKGVNARYCSCAGSGLSKRVNLEMKFKCTMPVGPLRCLATMISDFARSDSDISSSRL
jgi:hypothetical protein